RRRWRSSSRRPALTTGSRRTPASVTRSTTTPARATTPSRRSVRGSPRSSGSENISSSGLHPRGQPRRRVRLTGRCAVVLPDAESEPDRVALAERVPLTVAHRVAVPITDTDGRRLHEFRSWLSHRSARALAALVVSVVGGSDEAPRERRIRARGSGG